MKEQGELAAFHSQKVTFLKGLISKQYEVMGWTWVAAMIWHLQPPCDSTLTTSAIMKDSCN